VKERLQKILAHAGIASRRAAEKLIEEGRVEVDGRVVKELGTSADPDTQEIRVDGTRVRSGRLKKARRYVALNKPRGYVTTRSDPGHRPTVMELLPQSMQTLYPVGRLDMGSTGLLILTDDGELAHKLTHPRFGIEKSYLVSLAGRPDAKTLERATRGILVDGEKLAVEDVEILGRSDRWSSPTDSRNERTRLRATLRRGKNREIRRLFEALGFPVLELHRESIGALTVRGIPPGGFRPLTRAEVELLSKRGGRGATRLRAKRSGGVSPKPKGRRREGSERREERRVRLRAERFGETAPKPDSPAREAPPRGPTQAQRAQAHGRRREHKK
jgi:pseudouridine synthase